MTSKLKEKLLSFKKEDCKVGESGSLINKWIDAAIELGTVDVVNDLNQNFLMEAVRVGNYELVKLLLESGEFSVIRVDVRNNDGDNALVIAINNNYPNIVRLLLEYNASIYNSYFEKGWDHSCEAILDHVLEKGNSEILDVIKDYFKSSPNAFRSVKVEKLLQEDDINYLEEEIRKALKL